MNAAIKIGVGVGAAIAALLGGMAMAFGAPAPMVSAMTDTPRHHDSKPIRFAQASPRQTPTGSSLPGGASSLQESYEDWQVACVQNGPTKHCSMTQQQVNRQNRQRVLAVELAPVGDKLEGTLVLPFGILLDHGAVLQIDDGATGKPLHFHTCLPVGCIVPLSFDAHTVAALLHATTLKVKVVAEGDKEMSLSIPLKGFAKAHDRLTTLSQ